MKPKLVRPLLLVAIFICFFSCKQRQQTFKVICKHSDGDISEESEIISYKKDTSVVVQLLKNSKVVEEKILKEGYRPIIPLFVKELDTLTQLQKCHVVDSYIVYVEDVVINRVDRTCEWNGFARLKYALFDND